MNKRGITLIGAIIWLSLFHACRDKPKLPDKASEASPERGDLIVQAYLYEGEKITVWLNDTVFYTRSVKPGGGRMFIEDTHLPAEKISNLQVQTEYNGKIYIDTSFAVGTYYPEASLRIIITVPFPFDYRERLKRDTLPNWGPLPIDSSLRFFKFRTE